jgi:predicted DCC family thiol-disulfide oxidoreductase YuxK
MHIILFDGVCNFCNSSINFVIDRDYKNTFKFAPLQSDVASKLLTINNMKSMKMDSIILIEGNKIYTKSTAALRIAKNLSGAWFLLYYIFIPFPSFIRDFFYDIIARNRYKIFGKSEECRIPTPELKSKFL